MKLVLLFVIFLITSISSGCSVSQDKFSHVSINCLPIEENNPSFQLEDSLVLSGNETYILDGYSGRKVSLPLNPDPDYEYMLTNFMQSPDYEKLAYLESRYQKINGELTLIDDARKIFTNRGKEIIANQWELGFEYPIEWFDKDRIVIPATDDVDGTIILYNPITGEIRRIKPSFTDIYNFDPIEWYKSTNPLPLYNRSMSHVFYLRFVKDKTENNIEYVLYDLNKNKVLWSKTVNLPTIRPQWSPSQETIIIASQDSSSSDYDFFSVDQHGHENKLSDFSSVYDSNYIDGFSLSPDGEKIGFWLDGRSEENEYTPHFAIFNIKTKQTNDYCIGHGGDIFWSSSGNQIAFVVKERENRELWYTVVLDVKNNEAIKIADHFYPVGWILMK